MELIDKLKEYIKVLEKARDEYNKRYWREDDPITFESGLWSGMEHSTQACINDLNKMIEEMEGL